jgi:hypothetical protein
MRRLAPLILFCLPIAGCATGPSIAEQRAAIQAQLEREIADCRLAYPVAPRKNNVALARCINEANSRHMKAHPDIGAALAATRIAIATKMDAGKISHEEGEAQIAQARAQANSELLRRETSIASVMAQEEAAAAARAASRPRTCNVIGNTVNCY